MTNLLSKLNQHDKFPLSCTQLICIAIATSTMLLQFIKLCKQQLIELEQQMESEKLLWIAKMSGSGRLQLVMLDPNNAKICVA